jgi:hypothetical protein
MGKDGDMAALIDDKGTHGSVVAMYLHPRSTSFGMAFSSSFMHARLSCGVTACIMGWMSAPSVSPRKTSLSTGRIGSPKKLQRFSKNPETQETQLTSSKVCLLCR